MSSKSISKERLIYLDFIKVLAIYFVCFYHYNNFNTDFLSNPSISTYLSYFIKGIASTGVPLFFMVSGALMLNRNYNLNKHIRKIINIIILTIIWGMITLLILSPIKGNSYSIPGFVKALWTWEQDTINHLWFLQTLVCVYILYPLIKEVYDIEGKKVLNYILIVIFIFTFGNVLLNMVANIVESILGINYITNHEFNFFNNFNLFRGFYAYTLVYFIVGALLLEKLKNDMRINVNQIIMIFIIGISTLFLYGVMMSNSNKEVYGTVWNGYDTIMTLLMCISIFILSYISNSKLDKLSSVVQLIGENTLGIYFVHRMVGSILKPYYITLTFSTSIISNLVFGIVVMAMSLIITLVLKRIPIIKSLFKI
ncbi:TPA: acyltransferase [Clostridioides difficile]|nr:acyltransferase [Clostridioides difficile]